MINVLKKGYKTKPEDIVYYKKCRTCGCCFTYNISDIEYRSVGYDDVAPYVGCPECDYTCTIVFKIKYKEDKHGKIQKL